jgi:hypothetical protein
LTSPLHIFHDGDLYEVIIEGTIIYSIKKYFDGGKMFRQVGFTNLPQEVKDKIIQGVKKHGKVSQRVGEKAKDTSIV